MNAASECSFSAMRRLKTYLCSMTCQSWLNHLLLLNINREKVETSLTLMSLEISLFEVVNIASASSAKSQPIPEH